MSLYVFLLALALCVVSAFLLMIDVRTRRHARFVCVKKTIALRKVTVILP